LVYEKKIKLNDVDVVPHNAGHMLGSAQFEIRTPEATILYTGDFNCRDMLTTDMAKPVRCDILVLETTYGHPVYNFPDPLETRVNMVDWALREIQRGMIPVFKVYSAGKAQEVIKILNAFTSVPVVTQPTVTRVNQAYERNGVVLQYTDAENEEGRELLKSGECVYIISSRKAVADLERFSLAVATGWAARFRMNSVDAAFPLSCHADFHQLVEYVEQVKPRVVFTVHGFKDDFADYLSRRQGMRARPISPIVQKHLMEYL
jgi:putative mRNA 3-end processing factor